jgi:hypothetical protein
MDSICNNVEKEKNKLHSYHIFMFPFIWQHENNKKTYDNLDLVLNNKWEHNKFNFDNYLDYNEYKYFYKNVSNVLCGKRVTDSNKILKSYNYNSVEEWYYSIFVKQKKRIKIMCKDNVKSKKEIVITRRYDLKIDKIELKMYKMGIGILTFFLKNNSYSDKQNILNINQYGRRLYVPYLTSDGQIPYKDVPSEVRIIEKIKDKVKDVYLQQWDRKSDVEENYISNIIMGLLGDNFTFKHLKNFDNKIAIKSIIDDRMYTMCWYGNNNINSDKYDEWLKDKYINTINYEDERDFWSKYIFVDSEYNSIQNNIMLQQLVKGCTYTRWSKYNTLYGVSRYSFVMLSKDYKFLNLMEATYIVDIFKTMYYQMVSLTLLYRAAILVFSDKISGIIEGDVSIEGVSNIKKDYLEFINQMYFREVTAQEQGIELYNKMQEVCEIEKNINNLNYEISELYNYTQIIQNKKLNKLLMFISIISGIFVIPTFFTSFYGIIHSAEYSVNPYYWLLLFMGLPALAIFTIYMSLNFRNSKSLKNLKENLKKVVTQYLHYKNILILLFCIVIIFTIVFIDNLFLFKGGKTLWEKIKELLQ